MGEKLFLGTLVSEDLAYIYGLFSVQGEEMSALSFLFFFGAGVLFGDLLLYGLGVLLRRFPEFPLLTRVENWVQKLSKKQKY
ncbi:MAG: hypothetical protein AAF203_06575, partial [Pseudomonadota bacterium]